MTEFIPVPPEEVPEYPGPDKRLSPKERIEQVLLADGVVDARTASYVADLLGPIVWEMLLAHYYAGICDARKETP